MKRAMETLPGRHQLNSDRTSASAESNFTRENLDESHSTALMTNTEKPSPGLTVAVAAPEFDTLVPGS